MKNLIFHPWYLIGIGFSMILVGCSGSEGNFTSFENANSTSSDGVFTVQENGLTTDNTSTHRTGDRTFFADRLGGGPEDVFFRNLSDTRYQNIFHRDIVVPNAQGEYEISADANATVYFPYGVEKLSKKANAGDSYEQSQIAEDELGNLTIEPGKWRVNSNKQQTGSRANGTSAGLEEAYIEFDENSRALSIVKEDIPTPSGTKVYIKASLLDGASELVSGSDYSEVDVTVVEYLDGVKKSSVQKLRDNGLQSHGDENKDDGVFSGYVALTRPGKHAIQVTLEGKIGEESVRRSTVVRSFVSQHRLQVDRNRIEATQGVIHDVPLEAERYGLSLGVRSVKGGIPDLVNTYAQVWALDSEGNDTVVGWIGGLVEPVNTEQNKWSIPFSFHSGWLESGDFHSPLSLRNIEVRDIDSNDEILIADSKIEIDNLSSTHSRTLKSDSKDRGKGTPSSDMLRGVHPDVLLYGSLDQAPQPAIISKIGSRLGTDRIVLIMHGFCDGRKPMNHFSSTIQRKGRQYEQTLPQRGSSANRYATDVAEYFAYRAGKFRGIVAHSHGGMASASLLHNYSYLFADNASSRPPNVVAMGTPFWGSGLLEGRLPSWLERALVGVYEYIEGCNIPAELYPSSNSSWSNSIRWRARYQISAWFTTHTKPKTFENRDCRDFLSAQIRGSDDGVLAPSNGLGFADGGNTDLHYSGYCHMSGMGQGDQWRHPSFVNYVNNLFHSGTESWQPF